MPRTILRRILIAAIAIAVIGYAGYQSRNLILGATLEITEPEAGAIVGDTVLSLKGNATRISYLSLNGNQIFTDSSGAWSEKILLAPGWNLITLDAEDRFKNKLSRSIEVIYDAPLVAAPRATSTVPTFATSTSSTNATSSSVR